VLAINPTVSNPASTANKNVRVRLHLSAFAEIMATSDGRLEGNQNTCRLGGSGRPHEALTRGDCLSGIIDGHQLSSFHLLSLALLSPIRQQVVDFL
jgi:hypothetical protein